MSGQFSPLLRYVGLYGAYVLFLHTIPGPWHTWKEGREGKAIDPWTVSHVAWGLLGQRLGLTASKVTLLGSVNELVEHGVSAYRSDLLWGQPDVPANTAMDMVALLAGWGVGYLLGGGARRVL